jgi:glycosyltransferase involved in cell wall biosynthesis
LLKSPTVYYCGEPIRSLYDPEIQRPYINVSRWKRRINQFDPLPGLYHKVLAENDRKNVVNATLVLTNSAFSRENLYRAYGIFARICYLGVDTERFQPLHLPKESFVLSVGAVRPNKGFDFLLHSLSHINEGQRPHLLIVTNFVIPEERKYLEELSNQLGVKIEFQVLIPEEKLVQTYNRAILTLYAPILEPFGFVPIESMACGTPVVAINEGGIRESVQNRCTGLLTERDPQQFAEAVAALLKDKGRRTAFGAAGRDHVVENWRWERCITEIEKHLLLATQN